MKLTKKQWQRINQVLRERDIDPSQIKFLNCIRMHPDPTKETDEHVMGKVNDCLRLRRIKHPYLTEAWTADHKIRFDILDLQDNMDIEIETGKSKATKSYKADKEIKMGSD